MELVETVPKPGVVLLRVIVFEDARDEFDAVARARAAAIVSWLSIKG